MNAVVVSNVKIISPTDICVGGDIYDLHNDFVFSSISYFPEKRLANLVFNSINILIVLKMDNVLRFSINLDNQAFGPPELGLDDTLSMIGWVPKSYSEVFEWYEELEHPSLDHDLTIVTERDLRAKIGFSHMSASVSNISD